MNARLHQREHDDGQHIRPFTREDDAGVTHFSFRRLLEGVLIALAAAVCASMASTWATAKVLEHRLDAQAADIKELRDEVREMRRDLYRPRSGATEETMNFTSLTTRLTDSLHDAARVFDAGDFDRHVNVALRAMALEKRPLRRAATLYLVANQSDYAAPADLVRVERLHWENGCSRQPWRTHYLGPRPVVSHLQGDSGIRINLSPRPTQRQIDALGGALGFTYLATHAVVDNEIDTLADADEDLVILRAQAEACRELALRNITKPVTLRDGSLNQPRNSTPGALFKALIDEWKAAV